MANRTKALRVPEEFEKFLDSLSEQFSQQTGFPKNKTAVMRRMSNELNGKLIIKNGKFDWRLI